MVSHICTGIYVWLYLIFVPAFMYGISYLYWYLCMISYIRTSIFVLVFYLWYLIFVLIFMYGISYLYWYLCMVSQICTDIYVWYLIFVLAWCMAECAFVCVVFFCLFFGGLVGGGGGGICFLFVSFLCAFFVVVFFVVVVWGEGGGQKSTQSVLCNPVVPAALSLFEFPPPRPLFLNPSWPLSCKPPSWIFSLTELSACFPSQVTWLRSARRACPCGPRPTTLPSLTATSPSTTWLRTQSTNSALLPRMLLALANSVCPALQSKSKKSLVSEMVVHASVCLP